MRSRTQTTLDLICEIADKRRASDTDLLAKLERDLVRTLSPAMRASLRAFLEPQE